MNTTIETILREFLRKNVQKNFEKNQLSQLITTLLEPFSKSSDSASEEGRRQLAERLFYGFREMKEETPLKNIIRQILATFLDLSEEKVYKAVNQLTTLAKISHGEISKEALHRSAVDDLIATDIYTFLGPEGFVNVESLRVLTELKRHSRALFENNFPDQARQVILKEKIKELRQNMAKNRMGNAQNLSLRITSLKTTLNRFLKENAAPGDFVSRSLAPITDRVSYYEKLLPNQSRTLGA